MAFPFAESLPPMRDGQLGGVTGLTRQQSAPSDLFQSLLAILGGTGTADQSVDTTAAELLSIEDGSEGSLEEEEPPTGNPRDEAKSQFREDSFVVTFQGVPPSMFHAPSDLVVIPRLASNEPEGSKPAGILEPVESDGGIKVQGELPRTRPADLLIEAEVGHGEEPEKYSHPGFATNVAVSPSSGSAPELPGPGPSSAVTAQFSQPIQQEPTTILPSSRETVQDSPPQVSNRRIAPPRQEPVGSSQSLAFELAIRADRVRTGLVRANPKSPDLPGSTETQEPSSDAGWTAVKGKQLSSAAVTRHIEVPTSLPPTIPKLTDASPGAATSATPNLTSDTNTNPHLRRDTSSAMPSHRNPDVDASGNRATTTETASRPAVIDEERVKLASAVSLREPPTQEKKQTASSSTTWRPSTSFASEFVRTEVSTQEAAPIDPRDQIASLSESVETGSPTVQREARDFRIPLEPTRGGPIELRLEQRDGVVQVRVHAASADTRQALQQNLTELVSTLSEQGLLTHTSTPTADLTTTEPLVKQQVNATESLETSGLDIDPGSLEQQTGESDNRGPEQQYADDRDGRQSWQWREHHRRRRSNPWIWADTTKEVPWLISQE
jgi:flagellar hook-length control protein FliK